MFTRRDFLVVFGLCAGALVLGLLGDLPLGFAKDVYPAEKITCVVSHKAGGGYDIISRGVAPFLTKHLRAISPGAKGGEVIIKNEPAAAGIKAYSMIYYAKPDGYMIGTLDTAFATETLTSKLDFDLNKFTYLLQFNTTSRLLVCKKGTFANWEEMMKLAKTKELKWAVGQFGRAVHVDSIIIKETIGIPARLIPFGASAETMNALLRGDVHIATLSADSAKALLDSGEIKALADFSGKTEFPGVPNNKDLGYPDLADKVSGHRFFISSPGLPKEISNRLVEAFKGVLNDPEFLAWTKKSDIPLNPIYGDEAEKMAKKMYKLYQQDMKSILMKNLQ